MSSLIFKCCKHGTDPTDCPICQRIFLVWFLKQIRPDLLKEMVRYIASFLPKKRLCIRICSICLITRRFTDWSARKSEDIGGILCMDSESREVYINCGPNSKYFHATNRYLYLLKDGQRIKYEQFCPDHAPSYKFFLWDGFCEAGYYIICIYKASSRYSPDICDICIDKMMGCGDLEDVNDFADLSEDDALELEHDAHF